MAKLFANNGDLDQTLRSDLGLHRLPVTLLRVSRLQWVNLLLFCLRKLHIGKNKNNTDSVLVNKQKQQQQQKKKKKKTTTKIQVNIAHMHHENMPI